MVIRSLENGKVARNPLAVGELGNQPSYLRFTFSENGHFAMKPPETPTDTYRISNLVGMQAAVRDSRVDV